MYAAPIPDPNPESELSLAEIEATLRQVAGNLDSRFGSAGEALAQAHAIVERLIGALESITHALGRDAAEAAVRNMRTTAERLERLPAVQATRQAGLERIAAGARPLANHIAQIKRTLDFLRICGLNIKVAAAGRNGFADFADTMNVRLDVGEIEIGGIGTEIERLTASIPALIEVDRQLAAECAKVIPHVPRKLAEDAEALQRHQAGDAARAARIAVVAREIHGQMATAIDAMQIGDITRQRLEHIAAGIRALIAYRDRDDPAAAISVVGHMVALFAAQTSDTVEAFHRESQRLAESLRGIAPSAAQLLEIKAEGDRERRDEGGVFLAALEKSVADVAQVTARLRDADAKAQALGGSTSESAECLAERLRVVHRVNEDVHLMAWNTDLRCHRLGDEGKALAMVASEIRGFATTLATISGEIRKSVEAMVAAVTALRDPQAEEGADPAAALTESLACIHEGAVRMRDGLAGLGEDAAAVHRILESSTKNVDCEAAFGDSLRSAVLQLKLFGSPCAAPQGDVAAALAGQLDGMTRSYTMAREREIHGRFALPGSGASRQGHGEEDDDGLF